MSSLDKMLEILGLFGEDRLSLDLADVERLTGSSRPTCYRYLRSLTKAGLLSTASSGRYTIGSRVLEMARLQYQYDPLRRAAQHKIRYYAQEHGLNILLCSFYGDKVICTDNAWVSGSLPDIYQPGHALPIFRGAMGKSILAQFSRTQLAAIFRNNAKAIGEYHLGATLDEFIAEMAKLRSQRIIVTQGEVLKDLVGIASPILHDEQIVAGCVVIVVTKAEFETYDPVNLKKQVAALAASIEADIDSFQKATPDARPFPSPSRTPVFST
ncbi:MAG: hypothetical protein CML31_14395 [Rhizobiales bacterium]|nr:hypothetical protein [Hyphomicrobiales bacterium]